MMDAGLPEISGPFDSNLFNADAQLNQLLLTGDFAALAIDAANCVYSAATAATSTATAPATAPAVCDICCERPQSGCFGPSAATNRFACGHGAMLCGMCADKLSECPFCRCPAANAVVAPPAAPHHLGCGMDTDLIIDTDLPDIGALSEHDFGATECHLEQQRPAQLDLSSLAVPVAAPISAPLSAPSSPYAGSAPSSPAYSTAESDDGSVAAAATVAPPPPPPRAADSRKKAGKIKSRKPSSRHQGNPVEYGGLTDEQIEHSPMDQLKKLISKHSPSLQVKIRRRRKQLQNRNHARDASERKKKRTHALAGQNGQLASECSELRQANADLASRNRSLEIKCSELESTRDEVLSLRQQLRSLQARLNLPATA